MAKQARIFVVTGRHRPHGIAFMVLSLIFGVAYLVGTPPPPSVAIIMPGWLVKLWAGIFLTSGVLSFVGVAISRQRHPETGLMLEAGGQLAAVGALSIVLIALTLYTGPTGLFGIGFCLAWATANIWRALQIRRDVAVLRTAK